MADITTTSETLKFEFLYVDGDTNTLTLKNPKRNINTSDIEDLQTFMRTNNIVVGDRDGGTFGRIDGVTRVTEYKTSLDFSA